ncbi:hypothetical protein [Escherichia coli]|uniref:hypothetical protein n=1 Tax=Escherichia coli TaxID=562 RepID=UPI0038B321BD
MKLILPFPPSVNTYWRHPNKGAFAGKSLISAAGRKFQSAACAAIVEQLRRLPKPTSAPASVEIVLFPPDIRECLQWMIDDGVVSRIDLDIRRTGINELGNSITLWRRDGPVMISFDDLWSAITHGGQ